MKSRGLVLPLIAGILASTAAAQTPQHGSLTKLTVPKELPRAGASTQPQSSSLASAGADDCANASTSAISGTGTFPVNSTGATDSPQVDTGCVQPHLDVWFRYTATYTGSITLNTCGGVGTDSVIVVWSGSTCPAGTSLACNDDFCGLESSLTFPITNGSVYLIQMGSFGSNPGYSGTFNLSAPPPPPANDECTAPITVVGIGTFPFDNTAATTSVSGQTEAPCFIFGTTAVISDVWFTWTAPMTGIATFATCGTTTVDTKIAAYPGAVCPTAGTVLACNDDACGPFQSSIEFPVTGGSAYMLQIGLYPFALGGAGNFSLAVAPPPGPPTAASMNVDIGPTASAAGIPTSTYGAAAAMPGVWNARSPTVSSSLMNDLAGAPCQALLTRTGTSLNDFAFDNLGTSGDDQALLDDAQDCGGTGGTTTWTFSNLFGGNYTVYTYAWAPDSNLFVSSVSVAGSPDPAQSVGGAWTGAHVLGTTYARHAVTGVPSLGSIAITVSTVTSFSTLNGFQIIREGSSFSGYCFGDGTGTACPCGNSGALGNGCANSIVPTGGNLTASGLASVAADSIVITGSGMPNATCLYFQGTSQISVTFGDGLRCAGGTVIRLGTKANVLGTSSYPTGGDLSVSVRGAVPLAGAIRNYQCWYRNAAAFCTASTFNLTNGVSIPWTP